MKEIFSRNHAYLKAALAVLMLAAWAYLSSSAFSIGFYLTPEAICTRDGGDWSLSELGGTFALWVVMMVAMMIPTVLPWVLAFAKQAGVAGAAARSPGIAGLFLLGYFLAWSGFGLCATLLQWYLTSTNLLTPSMVIGNRFAGGALLIAVGAYQWSSLKEACLKHCESPFTFFLSRWRDGKWGALVMGGQHGLYCVGCCWLLMLFMLVVGMMSLAWMAGVTLYILLEMYVPGLRWISRILGGLLIATGFAFLTIG